MTAMPTLPPGGAPGNPPIPCTLTILAAGPALAAELAVREEHGDVVIDVALAGQAPFAALVLTVAAAVDLALHGVGTAAAIKRFGP